MASTFSSWWQKHWRRAVAFVVVLFSIFVLLAYVFGWSWVGVSGGDSKVTITMITPGATTATPATTVAIEHPPAKTLWDWLGLLAALGVPIVVGLGVAWFTIKFNEQQSRTERETTLDNQRAAALQEYINRMADLLLDKKLRESQRDTEVQVIARARTLTVLHTLDASRKRNLLQFLSEAQLINGTDISPPILDLKDADLSGADLTLFNLSYASLHQANLSDTNLSVADLSNAGLIKANLSGAKLTLTNLSGASLSQATLRGVDLLATDLSGLDLSDLDLSGAKLTLTKWSGAKLNNAKLNNAMLLSADLSDLDLSGADLSGAKLTLTKWSGVKLSGAKLIKADLSVTDLSDLDLSGADLSGAYLWKAKLNNAKLNNAKLNNSILAHTDLSGADLSGADLSNAVLVDVALNGAIVTKEQLDKVKKGLRQLIPLIGRYISSNLEARRLRNVARGADGKSL